MQWIDQPLGTLNSAQLPIGAWTGAQLAAWISSNYASTTYVEAQNSIEVASDGNRRILSDAELRDLFPNGPGYLQGAYATSPQSINHLLGGSYIDGALQIFPWVSMELGNAAHILGPLGTDIICKVTIDKNVGHVMKDQTDDGHLVELRGPITLRTLNFRLTDVDGNEAEEAARSAAGSPEPPEPAEPAEPAEPGRGADPEPVGPAAGDLPAIPPAGPADPVVAVPQRIPEPQSPRRRPRSAADWPSPPTSGGEPLPQAAVAPEPEQQPQQPEQPRRPVHLTPAQMRRVRQISRQNRFEQLAMANSMDV
ncbi:unnamed protein product [Symbiodinium pilosum]|uniref:Uncharacterized protein n=1 Tax=Symbiodinium pilosum TaxID=2952 RepID=A0A812UWP2_SYMPI|nr:unnamed protein product [Symbiodinium pilosum]